LYLNVFFFGTRMFATVGQHEANAVEPVACESEWFHNPTLEPEM
jgi:hypothetical protein